MDLLAQLAQAVGVLLPIVGVIGFAVRLFVGRTQQRPKLSIVIREWKWLYDEAGRWVYQVTYLIRNAGTAAISQPTKALTVEIPKAIHLTKHRCYCNPRGATVHSSYSPGSSFVLLPFEFLNPGEAFGLLLESQERFDPELEFAIEAPGVSPRRTRAILHTGVSWRWGRLAITITGMSWYLGLIALAVGPILELLSRVPIPVWAVLVITIVLSHLVCATKAAIGWYSRVTAARLWSGFLRVDNS